MTEENNLASEAKTVVADEAQTDATEGTAEKPAGEQPAQADDAEKTTKVEKRIAKLTYEREQARREAAQATAEKKALEAILDATRKGEAVPENFASQAKFQAAQEREIQEMNAAANDIFKDGLSQFPDFRNAVAALQEVSEIGTNAPFIHAIHALPNGPAVFKHLAENTDDASDILQMSPAKMAIELAKISGSLSKPAKPISKAPAPPEPIGGNAAPSSKDPSTMSMPEFKVWFAEQRKQRTGR